MNTQTITDIRKELQVAASQETAFIVFTQKMDLWWPRTHHVGKCAMTEMLLEPSVNGRWYSKHEDGSEVNVGYVMDWDPYNRVVLVWQINANYQCDPGIISEVEIKFIKESAGSTRILFEHRNLDRLGEGSKAIESMDQGWGMILNLYKDLLEKK